MATQLQIRRGTSSQVAAFTGAEGELVVNTTNDSVHVNDGSTAGGFELARVDGSNWANITTTANIDVGTVTADGLTVEKTSSGANVSVASLQNDGSGANTKADLDFHAANTKYATISGGYGASAPELDIKVGNTPSKIVTFTDGGDVSFYEDTGTTPKMFWDASSERLGIGTTSPISLLQLLGSPVATSGALATFRNSDATSSNTSFGGVLFNSSPGTDYSIGKSNVNAVTTLSFRNGNTGASFMDIDSSGKVGIGSTSPDALLRVNGTAKIGEGAASNTAKLMVNTASGVAAGIQLFQDGNESWIIENPASSTALTFDNSGTERMRIDGSGNVKIADGDLEFTAVQYNPTIYVPDAAANTYNVGDRGNITIQASNSTSGSQAMSGGRVLINAGNSNNGQTGDIVLSTGVNLLNSADKGTIRFNIGGTASSDEAARLDASGRLLLGTTSNSGGEALQVDANNVGATVYTALMHNSNTSTSAYNVTRFTQGASGSAIGMVGTGGSATSNTAFRNSFVVGTQSSSPLVFVTADAERMRVDSGGRVLINTTAGSYTHDKGLRVVTGEVGSHALDSAVNIEGSGGDFYPLSITGPSNVGFGKLAVFSSSTDSLYWQYRSGGSSIFLNRVDADGDFHVYGALSKASGSFRIDHPLPEKTATHDLVHSFIEGPQADNIYRGTVDLVDGSATVNIDTAAGMTEGTYVALNTNTQCFTSNESGWTAVKGSVSGNTLTITAQENTCTDTVSWMVVGERKDPHMIAAKWTDENGKVIVEPLKENN